MDMVDYAKLFIGTPYMWGGEHPSHGYDCSGFVQEVLASQGFDPPGDQTAQDLFNYFIKVLPYMPSKPQRNDLLFFGSEVNKITHVAIAVDKNLMIESGGGDSKTRSLAVAIAKKAMVRQRPIRKDLIGIIRVTE